MNKDIFGFEVEVGDTVAYNPAHYKGLVTGIVKKLTPKGFSISRIYEDGNVSESTFNTGTVVLDLTGIYKGEIKNNSEMTKIIEKHLEGK